MALCFAFLALYHLLAKDNRWGFTFTLSMMENCIEAYNNNFTTRTYSLTTKICVNTTLDNLITTLISKIIKLTTPYLFEKKIGVKWKNVISLELGFHWDYWVNCFQINLTRLDSTPANCRKGRGKGTWSPI